MPGGSENVDRSAEAGLILIGRQVVRRTKRTVGDDDTGVVRYSILANGLLYI